MTVIVTDKGFSPETWTEGFTALGAANDAEALDISADTQPDDIPICSGLKMVRIDFPSSADGRGFTIARALRLRGYQGRLRARGHVLADQYAMARRSGFDEIEINGLEVSIKQGDSYRLNLNVEKNLFDYMTVEENIMFPLNMFTIAWRRALAKCPMAMKSAFVSC